MKKTILISCATLLISMTAYSQILKPVRWSYAAKKTSATEAIIYIKATIDQGWHLYSQYVKDGGPSATKFTFLPPRNYLAVGKTTEPKPISKFEPVFMMEVSYFANSVMFQQKIKLKTKNTVVNGKVEFMACNDKQCLPPSEVEFSIPVK